MESIKSAYKLQCGFTKEEYLRAVLIELTAEKTTPTDILKSEFGEIIEEKKEYLLLKGDVDLAYTCSIGYDRKEEYYEEERDFEKERKLNNGVKYYKNVKKTRTVTDWSPFQGTRKSSEAAWALNTPNSEDYTEAYFTNSRVNRCILATKEELVIACTEEEKDNIELFSTGIRTAKSLCESSCFVGVKFPGDHHKNEEYSAEVYVTKIVVAEIPEYNLEYEYKGVKHKTKGFACGSFELDVDKPSEASDVNKEVKQKTKPIFYGAIGALILGVVLNLFMDAIGGWCILAYLAAVGLFVAKYVMGKKYEKNIYAARQEEKKQALIDILAKKGLKELTAEELEKLAKI